MSTLDEITKEKQRISEALARVDVQHEKLTSELSELKATERVLTRYGKGTHARRTPAANPPDRPDQMAGSWRRYYEHSRDLTLERCTFIAIASVNRSRPRTVKPFSRPGCDLKAAARADRLLGATTASAVTRQLKRSNRRYARLTPSSPNSHDKQQHRPRRRVWI
jgi:hypothetical protein